MRENDTYGMSGRTSAGIEPAGCSFVRLPRHASDGRRGLSLATTLLVVLPALLQRLPALAAEPAAATAVERPEPARIEGAIAGGLRWLAEHQRQTGTEAGAWPVGIANYRPAIASLAGMAFLANGHLPGDGGPYGKTVAAALKYVTGAMASDGYVGQGDRSGMYIHAISTLFALSCLGMQADEKVEPELADWCRRSLEVIVKSQQISRSARERGGWRYDPYTSESDVSVTCWQLLVLHTARQAGFEVAPSVFISALSYLNRAYLPVKPEAGREKSGAAGGYLYRPGYTHEPSRSSTALVLFIQSLFGAADEKRSHQVLTYLRRYPLTWDGSQYGGYFFFSGFYMVQGMFQVGGPDWESFGPRMGKLLLDHQTGDGSWPYPPNNYAQEEARSTGTAYPVAIAVLMLSLDKQYLPMYQRQCRIYERGGVSVTLPEEMIEEEMATPSSAADDRAIDVPIHAVEADATRAPVGGDAGESGSWEEPEDTIDRTIGRPVFR